MCDRVCEAFVGYVAGGADEFGVSGGDGLVSSFSLVEGFWVPNVGDVCVGGAGGVSLPVGVFAIVVEDQS